MTKKTPLENLQKEKSEKENEPLKIEDIKELDGEELEKALDHFRYKPFRAVSKPASIAGSFSASFSGAIRSFRHATFILFFSDNSIRREKVVSESYVNLQTRSEDIKKAHAPLLDRSGNHWFFVKEGEEITTDNIVLSRCLYDAGKGDKDHDKRMRADLALRRKHYEMTLEIQKSTRYNSPPMLMIIALVGLGFAMGLAYATIVEPGGNDITVENGDYVEEKNENNNQNNNPNNNGNSGGGTVVVP